MVVVSVLAFALGDALVRGFGVDGAAAKDFAAMLQDEWNDVWQEKKNQRMNCQSNQKVEFALCGGGRGLEMRPAVVLRL